MASVMWFRRDLRVHDHPALLAAARDAPLVALFVLDEALSRPSGAPRLAYLYRSLRALDEDLKDHGGHLVVRRGSPQKVVPMVAEQAGASAVHISADFGPYGAARDEKVAEALGKIRLVRTGSPYAIAPGRVAKPDGTPFRVYSAFYRHWTAHGWRTPAASLAGPITWAPVTGQDIPAEPTLAAGIELPAAGERAARAAWTAYRGEQLGHYAADRNRPDLDSTSRMSIYLKYGNVHPRTLLADLGALDETYRKELAWREFYAAILHFFPASAREYYLPEMAQMTYASGPQADAHLQAWKAGRTGFPIVDAGMRQLRVQGWMHNRVRMIVASFLVKDLHLEWTVGARHFMDHLVDGDLASNQHGWQWTAGCGTDAAPYFRIFNPITQGQKFDPDGDYVRRWVPELRAIAGQAVHEPWKSTNGAPDYPAPIVDHSIERAIAMARYQAIRRY